jgi:hypothetical protein
MVAVTVEVLAKFTPKFPPRLLLANEPTVLVRDLVTARPNVLETAWAVDEPRARATLLLTVWEAVSLALVPWDDPSVWLPPTVTCTSPSATKGTPAFPPAVAETNPVLDSLVELFVPSVCDVPSDTESDTVSVCELPAVSLVPWLVESLTDCPSESDWFVPTCLPTLTPAFKPTVAEDEVEPDSVYV